MENFVGNQMQQMLLAESNKPETKYIDLESPANVNVSGQSDADSDEFFDAVDDLFKYDSTPGATSNETPKEEIKSFDDTELLQEREKPFKLNKLKPMKSDEPDELVPKHFENIESGEDFGMRMR